MFIILTAQHGWPRCLARDGAEPGMGLAHPWLRLAQAAFLAKPTELKYWISGITVPPWSALATLLWDMPI